jgi:hypothetical protein
MRAGMRGADRIEDAWELSDGSAAHRANDDEETIELADLIAAQRAGAAWFGAEFARREEAEQREREAVRTWRPVIAHPEPVDASVEDDVVGGAPNGLGIA